MTKVLFAASVFVMCTISSYSLGCVTGAGPAWEVGGRPGPPAPVPGIRPKPFPGIRPEPFPGIRPEPFPGIRPEPGLPGEDNGVPGLPGPSPPRIPSVVINYFAGRVNKDYAFGVLDENGDGQVSEMEWVSKGGDRQEFAKVLSQLDTNRDGLISLAELQPFHLPVDRVGQQSLSEVLRQEPDSLPVDLPRRRPPGRIPLPRDPGLAERLRPDPGRL